MQASVPACQAISMRGATLLAHTYSHRMREMRTKQHYRLSQTGNQQLPLFSPCQDSSLRRLRADPQRTVPALLTLSSRDP